MEDELGYTSEQETAEILADPELTAELLEALADTNKSGYVSSEAMGLLMAARAQVARTRMRGLTEGQTIL